MMWIQTERPSLTPSRLAVLRPLASSPFQGEGILFCEHEENLTDRRCRVMSLQRISNFLLPLKGGGSERPFGREPGGGPARSSQFIVGDSHDHRLPRPLHDGTQTS